MSWDPDAETLPVPLHDTVTSVAIAIAVAVPLLMLGRLFSLFA